MQLEPIIKLLTVLLSLYKSGGSQYNYRSPLLTYYRILRSLTQNGVSHVGGHAADASYYGNYGNKRQLIMDQPYLRFSTRRPVVSQMLKRDWRNMPQSVCPSHAEFRNLSHALNMNGTRVELFQPRPGSDSIQQWFHVETCRNREQRELRRCDHCCIGIDHQRYLSSCSEQKSWVFALARRPDEQSYDWMAVQINTSCACTITRRNHHPHHFFPF